MQLRTKALLSAVILLGVSAAFWSAQYPAASWLAFAVLMTGVLASSGFKVVLPQGEGTMSLNFPFILLAIAQLSPGQAVLISAVSVLVQCRFRARMFSTVQVAFNLANVVNSTSLAYLTCRWLIVHGMTLAPSLGIASTVYFLSSTAFVALAIAWSTDQPAWQTWRTQFPWYLPFYLIGAAFASLSHAISQRYGWGTALLMVPVAYTLYRSYSAQIVRIRERQQHLEETEALHQRTIEGLAMAIEAKDRNTHDHLFRVRNYVTEIGRAFSLSAVQMQALQTAAFLHDIGKLAVPEHIINKPGKLTPEEFEKMKIHPVVGADILERVRFPYPVVPIVRSHHEWWNGSGYPDGLTGDAIPIGARILSAVDCFDALASDRPYRRRLPVAEALGIVKRMAGVQFDPKVVEVLEQHFLRTESERDPAAKTAVFQPLDTDIEVRRGDSPAAGFAAAGTNGETETTDTPNSYRSTAAGMANLVATANQEAQALFEMSQAVASSLSFTEMVSVIVSRLRRLVQFESSVLFIKRGDSLQTQFIEGPGSHLGLGDHITLGDGISGWVAVSGKPMLNADAKLEANYVSSPGDSHGLHSALSIPLFNLQQQVLGVLTLYAIGEEAFTRDHLRLLQVMETKLSLALENALNARQSATDLDTDQLTSLPNSRKLFLQLEAELARCRQTCGSLAVVVCDLKSFKEINDLHGHLAGNMLLSMIAAQFRQSCRPRETLARMGGNEFVFLIPDPLEQDMDARCERITQDVISAVSNSGLGTKVSASLGVATYPIDATTAEELLSVADRRMYLSKATLVGAPARPSQAVY